MNDLDNHPIVHDRDQLSDLIDQLKDSDSSIDKIANIVKDFTEKTENLSSETQKVLREVSKLLHDRSNDDIINKIRADNAQELLSQQLGNITDKITNLQIHKDTLSAIKKSSTAEDVGDAAGTGIMDLLGNTKLGKVLSRGKLGIVGNAGKLVKGAGLAAAGFSVYDGIKDIIDGKKIESADQIIPEGLNALNPFAYAMNGGRYIGGKIDTGYGALSKALGGSGSLGSDIYDAVHPTTKQAIKSISSIDRLHDSLADNSNNKSNDKTISESIAEGFRNSSQIISDSVAEGYRNGSVPGAIVGGVKSLPRAASALGSGFSEGANILGSNLGLVSRKYESGRRGVASISSGSGDNGGVSYGEFQLATNNGSIAKFLSSKEASGIAGEFSGLKPGTAEFNAKYKEITSGSRANEMQQAQYDYIKNTHFNQQAKRLKDKLGIDVSKESRGFQEAVWSTAVQYGPNSDIIVNALKGRDLSKMSDADKINAIQDYKARTVDTNFAKSSAKVRKSVSDRIRKEQNDLIALNGNPEIENLRRQGMPESDIRKISDMAGLVNPKSSTKPRTDPSKLHIDSDKSVASNTAPASSSSANISNTTIINSQPVSGFSVDAMRFNGGV